MVLALSGPAAWVFCVGFLCLTILALAFGLRWWWAESESEETPPGL